MKRIKTEEIEEIRKAAAYLRNCDVSLTTQRREITKWANEYGIEVVFFKETEDFERHYEKYYQMIRDAEAELYDCIVAYNKDILFDDDLQLKECQYQLCDVPVIILVFKPFLGKL